MPPSAKYLDLPFMEAIELFRQKVNLPTQTWKDLWQGMHSRAFVVAGATKSELLSDLRASVDKAISQGTTLAEFRRDFDETVQKHGWTYKGSRGWRTATILNTNLATAYASGRYKQMTDPDILRVRPYWRYLPSISAEPRPEHKRWYNLVLPYDDPFWDTHEPPNGWGCKCGVTNMSAREMQDLQDKGVIRTDSPEMDYYEWTDKRTGEVHQVPKGIDPGWDYSPGKSAWGKKLSDQAMSRWRAEGANAYQRLTPGDWKTYTRPELIPADPPQASIGEKLTTVGAAQNRLEDLLGDREKIFTFQADDFRHDILVNAESLAKHIDLERTPYLPFLPEALEDPFEVWLSFERHKGTKQVMLRQRVIKSIQLDKDRGLLLVAQSKNGIMEAWTIIPVSNMKYLQKQRIGQLIWGRK